MRDGALGSHGPSGYTMLPAPPCDLPPCRALQTPSSWVYMEGPGQRQEWLSHWPFGAWFDIHFLSLLGGGGLGWGLRVPALSSHRVGSQATGLHPEEFQKSPQ